VVASPDEVTVDQRRLVERARQGDHDAFAELVRAAIARLDTAARLILRDPELARDAVQEGLIRAWRDLRRLRDPDRFEAWLYRLTVNACLDQARRRRRRPIEVEITLLFAPSGPDPAIAVADRDLVDSVMRGLDEQGRAIVVLHWAYRSPMSRTHWGSRLARSNRDCIPIICAVFSAAEPGASASTRAGRPVRRTRSAAPPSPTSKRRPTGTSPLVALHPATRVASLPVS
jgi:RNA polymerase sigma factor (sigma-70 family)